MPNIDRRVVDMQFNNAQFEKNIAVTQKSLEKLNGSLKFNNAAKGFQDITQASNKVNMSKLAAGIETISSKFSTLGIIGVTALQNITNRAVDAGFKIANALTSAITSGGKSRALNLEAAQFQIEGLGASWEKVLDDVNYGVKDTAYGLDSAARVASQLLASQVQVGDNMKNALRSISGVAAMTNSTYDDIGSIYTTVAGNGRLMSEQLLQLSSRGLNAAAALGQQLGKSEKEIRDMVSKGQIDFQTFANAMDAAFGAHAKEANKTFTGALSNMKAALSRFGAAFYTPGLEYMRDVINALTPVIDSAKKALMPLIDGFNRLFETVSKRLAGFLYTVDFEKALEGKLEGPVEKMEYAFHRLLPVATNLKDAFKSFIEPIKAAFTAIFPPMEITKSMITSITQKIQDVTKSFILNEETTAKLTRVFQGLFSIISIGITIAKAIGNAFKPVIENISKLVSPLLDMAAAIGDFLVRLNDSIKGSEKLSSILGTIASAIGSLFSNITDALSAVSKGFSGIINGGTESAIGLGERASGILGKILETIKNFFVSFLESFNLRNIFDTLNAALSGGLLVVLINFFQKLKVVLTKGANNTGIINSITTTLKSVQSALFDMQNTLKAYSILTIAAAIGVMAFSLVKLSQVDAAGLTRGLAGLSGVIINLVGAMYLLSLIQLPKGGANVVKTAIILTSLGIAINILTKAVARLAGLDWQGLGKGLAGVAVLCGELVAVMKFADFERLKAASMIGLIALAESLNIMSKAVEKLSALDPKDLGKGLMSVATLLASIVGFTRLVGNPKGLISTGVGLIAIATAINILSKGIASLGALSLAELGKGLGGMAAALALIAATIKLMPKDMIAKGVALIFIATAVKGLSSAVKTLGELSLASLAKGLIGLGGALVIIAGAMRLMQASIRGALALNIIAGSLMLLTPVLVTLGSMSLEHIGLSLLALAGAFAVLGGAATLLQPVIPAMLGLSASVALLGVGMAAAGAGILAVSVALGTLVAVGSSGVIILTTMVESLIGLIPMLFESIGEGIVSLLGVLTKSGGALKDFLVTLFTSILDAIKEIVPKVGETLITLIDTVCNVIITSAPKIGEALIALIDMLLMVLTTEAPKIVDAGITIIFLFIQGMMEHAYEFGQTAAFMISEFLRGISNQIGRIIDEAIKLAIAFINGTADGIRDNQDQFKEAVKNLIMSIGSVIEGLFWDLVHMGEDIINGIIDGIKGMGQSVMDAIGGVFNGAIDWVKNLLGIHSPSTVFAGIAHFCLLGSANEFEKNGSIVSKAAGQAATGAVTKFKKALSSIKDIDIDMDMNPTITPVIDMSNVDRGIDRMESRFNKPFTIDTRLTSMLAQATALPSKERRSVESETSQPTQVINNYDMTQNNYSPKALSRIDIYRSTRNQFSKLKGVTSTA